MATRTSLLVNVCLVATSTIVSLIASDLVLRLIGYRPGVYADWLLRTGNQYRVPNRDVILIDPEFLGAEYYATESGSKTIVTLGDSFTDGYPVNNDYSYPEFLKRWLNHQGANVNVINMGLGQSGPDQHLRLFKEYVLPRVDVDAVVWTFYSNDIKDNLVQGAYSIDDSKLVQLNGNLHWLAIRQRLHMALPLPLSAKESSPILRLLYLSIQLIGQKLGTLQIGGNDIAYSKQKIRLAIRELNRLSDLERFDVYIVLIAPQAQYFDLLGEASPLQASSDLQRLGRRHVENHSALRSLLKGEERYIDAWFGVDSPTGCGSERGKNGFRVPADLEIFADGNRDENHIGNRHFNEAGYTLMAATVGRCLIQSKSDMASGAASDSRRPEQRRSLSQASK